MLFMRAQDKVQEQLEEQVTKNPQKNNIELT
jgi:hypothetical protein